LKEPRRGGRDENDRREEQVQAERESELVVFRRSSDAILVRLNKSWSEVAKGESFQKRSFGQLSQEIRGSLAALF